MTTDFMTILWKEWKEILLQRSAGGGGARQPLIVALIVGVLMPLRMGPQHYFGPGTPLLLMVMSAAAISAVVAEAFAGERERHTLETLLASRLSDQAILLGKFGACVGYGWLISIACGLLGIVTVNVANWHGQILMFHDAASWLGLILGPPLLGAAVASAGVFVSLHAATVRQAQQTLGVGLMVLIFGIVFGYGALSEAWKARLMQIVLGWSLTELILLGAGVVLAIDLALVLAAMARFQRAKLVLD
jgi:ABC-2 type transport system permease protein